MVLQDIIQGLNSGHCLSIPKPLPSFLARLTFSPPSGASLTFNPKLLPLQQPSRFRHSRNRNTFSDPGRNTQKPTSISDRCARRRTIERCSCASVLSGDRFRAERNSEHPEMQETSIRARWTKSGMADCG